MKTNKQKGLNMTKEIKKKEEFSMQDALMRVCQDETINPERLEKFLDLQIKMEERQNEKDLNAALANFQAECPIIPKTKKGHNSDYAPLDEIVYLIKPILNKHGLSFSFTTDEKTNEEKEMTVIVRHKSGGSYESKSTFPSLDSTKSMNNSQRARSANSYAKRTALENALGIVSAGVDDDAGRSVDNPITDDQIEKINTLLGQTKTDLKKFTSHLKVNNLGELSEYEAKKGISQLKQKRAFMGGKNV